MVTIVDTMVLVYGKLENVVYVWRKQVLSKINNKFATAFDLNK